MKFNPAADYDSLLKQAYSLAMLVTTQEEIISCYRKKDYLLSETRLAGLERSLESEREMNEKLTNEATKAKNE